MRGWIFNGDDVVKDDGLKIARVLFIYFYFCLTDVSLCTISYILLVICLKKYCNTNQTLKHFLSHSKLMMTLSSYQETSFLCDSKVTSGIWCCSASQGKQFLICLLRILDLPIVPFQVSKSIC
jgi:hypothetical protein